MKKEKEEEKVQQKNPLQEYYIDHQKTSVQSILEKSIYLNERQSSDSAAKELLLKKFTLDAQKHRQSDSKSMGTSPVETTVKNTFLEESINF